MKKIYLLLTILSIFALTGCNKNNNQNNELGNKEEVKKAETNEIEVEQKSLEYRDGVTYIIFNINNVSDKDIRVKQVEISYKKGEETEKLVSIIDDTLVPGQIVELQASTEYDLSNVEVDYKVVKE